MEEDLKFQRYSNDKMLGGSSPSVDSGPRASKHKVNLSPRTYHDFTTDKSLEWLLEQAIDPLKDLLI